MRLSVAVIEGARSDKHNADPRHYVGKTVISAEYVLVCVSVGVMSHGLVQQVVVPPPSEGSPPSLFVVTELKAVVITVVLVIVVELLVVDVDLFTVVELGAGSLDRESCTLGRNSCQQVVSLLTINEQDLRLTKAKVIPRADAIHAATATMRRICFMLTLLLGPFSLSPLYEAIEFPLSLDQYKSMSASPSAKISLQLTHSIQRGNDDT